MFAKNDGDKVPENFFNLNCNRVSSLLKCKETDTPNTTSYRLFEIPNSDFEIVFSISRSSALT
jgi:hypothetical protein